MDDYEIQATDSFCDVTPEEMAEYAEYCDQRDADFIECLEYLYFANAVYVDREQNDRV